MTEGVGAIPFRVSNKGITILRRMTLIEWALERYYIGGEKLSFREYPYLADLLLCDSPEQVVKKSAQVGVSEYCVMLSLYVADELQKTSLYLFPTRGHIGDFVRQRVDPIIDTSAYFQGRLKAKSPWENRALKGSSASVANVGLKRIGGRGFIFLRGTKSKNDVISVPADLLVVDELDECVAVHVPLAIERLAASTLKWQRKVSTPWFPGGPIDRAYEGSDARVWLLRCGSCGHHQALNWYKHIVREVDEGKEGVAFIPRDPEATVETAKALSGDFWREAANSLPSGDLRPVCEECGKVIDRHQFGEWVAQHPGRSVIGWHVSRLVSHRKTLSSLFHEFMHAQTSSTEIAIFHRMALGEGYDEQGNGLTPPTLNTIAQDYNPDAVRADFVTAGVDVGAKINVQVSKVQGKKRIMVYKNAVKSFKDVQRIFDMYKVNVAVIDALPETREVKRFRDEQTHGRVYLATFGLRCEGQATDEKDWLQFDHIACHVKCDRTLVFDEATHALTAERPSCVFPTRFLEDQDWVDQMCAPRRFLVTNNEGKTRAVWDEGGRPDHYRLADVYDFLAFKAFTNKQGMVEPPEVGYSEEDKEDESEADPYEGMDSEDAKILKRLLKSRRVPNA